MHRASHCFSLLLSVCLVAHSVAIADERLPAYLIRLPASVTTIFVAETTTSAFHQFDSVAGGIDYRGRRDMSIGRQGAGKQKEGDGRTPLGVYFVTDELDTRPLHEKYGITAFTLDYPNIWDLRQKRSGGGIWIHGVDPDGGTRPPRDTEGCISLANEDLAELADEFLANITPVVVTREIVWSDAGEVSSLRSELEKIVGQWTAAFASGDMHAYLSLYDEGFERWGMQRSEWLAFSMQTLGQQRISSASASDLLLLGDPVEDDLYLSRFRLSVNDGLRKTTSTKRLYWRRDESGSLKIVAEDSG